MKPARTAAITLTAALLFLYLTRALPFHSRKTLWTLDEHYSAGQIPSYRNIGVHNCIRTSAGLRVGDADAGVLEWQFAEPGPLPTVVVPDWDPDPNFPSVISLVLPSSPTATPYVLSRGLPLRYRALDFTRFVKDHTAYALRFEGQQAFLRGITFYQSAERRPSAIPFLIVFILLVFFLPGGRDSRILLAITAVGFILRWQEFMNYFSVPLAGDAVGYRAFTADFRWIHPLATGDREPFFIWISKLGTLLWGDPEHALRFTSLVFACASIVLIGRLPSAFSWPAWVGWVAAGMYALNPFAIFMSVQGYQLEVYTFLIVAFLGVWQQNRPLPMGVLSAALCLTRIQFFFTVLPLAVLAGWRFRWKKQEAIRFLVPFLLLIGPYLIAMQLRSGSPFGHLHRHANYYQAAEKLGDPTRAPELPNVNTWQLLFANQSIFSLAGKTLRGYAEIFFNPQNSFNRIFLNSHYALAWNLVFLPFFWVGLGACLRRKEGRWFLVSLLLFLNVLPFFQEMFREPRLLFHAAPWVAVVTAAGLAAVVQWRPRRLFQAR